MSRAPELENPADPPRRSFLRIIAGALWAVAAAAAAAPIVGYFLSPLIRRKKDSWVSVGDASDFPLQQTRLVKFVDPDAGPWDGVTARRAAYVRRVGAGRTAKDFVVFDVSCAHLGCPVSWFAESGLFLCPCHGGSYYEDGSRAAGPPPRGLYQFDAKVEAGKLLIHAGHIPTLQDPLRKTGSAAKSS